MQADGDRQSISRKIKISCMLVFGVTLGFALNAATPLSTPGRRTAKVDTCPRFRDLLVRYRRPATVAERVKAPGRLRCRCARLTSLGVDERVRPRERGSRQIQVRMENVPRVPNGKKKLLLAAPASAELEYPANQDTSLPGSFFQGHARTCSPHDCNLRPAPDRTIRRSIMQRLETGDRIFNDCSTNGIGLTATANHPYV